VLSTTRFHLVWYAPLILKVQVMVPLLTRTRVEPMISDCPDSVNRAETPGLKFIPLMVTSIVAVFGPLLGVVEITLGAMMYGIPPLLVTTESVIPPKYA